MRLPTPLLLRKADANKGDLGHIFILAGSARFSGAAVLSAEAAMRSGAGLVTLGLPAGINNAVIKIKPREVMTLPLPQSKEGGLGSSGLKKVKDFLKKADVLALGPGLGQGRGARALIRKVVSFAAIPTVIDADALNALTGHLGLLRSNVLRTTNHEPRTTIITPHPGEMARLLGASIAAVQANREETAERFAARYKVTVVLKGHHSIVAGVAGDIYVNKTGNPGMATAGSGDVLTGMIAAFLGQGLGAFAAAKYAVYLHGLAGDLAAKEKTEISLLAGDIIAKIPEAVKLSS